MARDHSRGGRGLRSFGSAALPYPGRLIETLAVLLTLGGIGWALDIYNRIGLGLYDQQYLAVILAIALAMAFLKFPVTGKQKKALPWYDALAAAVGFVAVGYLAYHYPTI